MNSKTLVTILTAGGAGFIAGFFVAKKKHDRDIESMIDDIYNECYRQAEAELKTVTKIAEEPKTEEPKKSNIIQLHEHGRFADITRPYRAYDKPPLGELVKELEEEEKQEMSDQEFFGDEQMDDDRSVEDEIKEDLEAVADDDADSNSPNRYLTEREYDETNLHFNKLDIFYYRQDRVFTGEDDQPMTPDDDIYDEGTVDIDRKLFLDSVIHVRNYHLGTDFRIYCLPGAFHDIVAETYKERERRLARRKMRGKE